MVAPGCEPCRVGPGPPSGLYAVVGCDARCGVVRLGVKLGVDMRKALLLAMTIAGLGCPDDERSESAATTPGITTVTPTDPSDEDDDAPETDEPVSESGDEDILDVGVPEDRDGCLYVDLLFVIDNSGSMCDFQQGLADALPGLIDSIWATLPDSTEIHVGIVTTSFSIGGSHQERDCAAAEGAGTLSDAFITDYEVDGNGFQGRLFEFEGERFFTANTSTPGDLDPLKAWFSGAAVAVGCEGGAFEFPAAAAAYVFHEQNAEHNAGFIRDAGAALGIFVLTNEVDHSPEPMSFYHDVIADAKRNCGGDDCIVTAGLLSPECVPSADPVVWQFLNAFGSVPEWGDILDFSGYGTVVSGALAGAIVDTCEDIAPAG